MENLDDTAESVTFGTTVVDEGHQLRVNLPANTEIKINFV